MTDPTPVMSPRSKRFADAVQRATRAAVLAHAQAGRSVAESRDGHLRIVSPDEVFALAANGWNRPSTNGNSNGQQ